MNNAARAASAGLGTATAVAGPPTWIASMGMVLHNAAQGCGWICEGVAPVVARLLVQAPSRAQAKREVQEPHSDGWQLLLDAAPLPTARAPQGRAPSRR